MVLKIQAFVRDNYFFRRFPVTKQLTKFAMVGVTSFFVDLGVYVFLTRNTDFFEYFYLLANAVSFVVSVGWSFLLNKFWTFKIMGRQGIGRQSLKFFLVSTIGLGLATLLLYIGVNKLQIFDVLAKFLVAFIVMFWNFLANKFWTFRKQRTIIDET